MADYSVSYTLPTAVTGKTNAESYELYHNLKSACDNMRNNGLVAYSKIESATLEVSGDLNTSSNPAMMGVYWLNSSGSYDKITTSEQDIQIGGRLGEKWTTGLSVTNKFESENSSAGYIKSSYGGTSANHIRVSFVHVLLLTSFTYSTKYKLTINFNKPRAIVTVTKSGEGTVTGAGTYHYGNSYTITATPATGWKFVKWSDGNTNASRTFTVNSSLINAYETQKSYQAIFEKQTYTVTWKNADGTVLETDTGVAYGTTPTYNGSTPTKAYDSSYHYTFKSWDKTVGAITGNTTYTATFNSVAHSYTSSVTAQPTCTATGVRTYTCSCGHSYTETIPAKGHIAGAAVVENKIEATCTADGSYDEVVYCSVCGTELSRNKKTISAKGHSYTTQTFEPTETSPGYTRYTCSGCGHSYDVDFTYRLKMTVENCTVEGVVDGGIYAKNSKVNFTIIADEGYEYKSAVAYYPSGETRSFPRNTGILEFKDNITFVVTCKPKPPEITSAQLLYSDRQVSQNNKVKAGEGFRIIIDVQ